MARTLEQTAFDFGELIQQTIEAQILERTAQLEEQFEARFYALEERVSTLERDLNGHGTSYGNVDSLESRIQSLERSR